MVRREFETVEAVEEHLSQGGTFANAVFQGLNLLGLTADLLRLPGGNSVFLGCTLSPEAYEHLGRSDVLLFPRIPGLPYKPYRGALYTPEELLGGYEPGVPGSYGKTLDGRIYAHYKKTGGIKPPSILESLGRWLHDHAISDALEEALEGRMVVAIMGGHAMARGHDDYAQVAALSRDLTRRGFFMVSGGGPGAMEATHLGAWFASRRDAELEEAIRILAHAPLFTPVEAWYDAAFEVARAFPLRHVDEDCASLGIPTWLFGHEPPAIFATQIAKLFANSFREDQLVSIATAGIIFAPGSAGTIQEIFQDATQNHYESLGPPSPMIFFGKSYWTHTKPVYPLLTKLAQGRRYASCLALTDSPSEVVAQIESHDKGFCFSS